MRRKPKGPSSGVLIKAAMDYGRLGWSVVPIQPKAKESLVRWQVFQHRPPATTEIGDWFTRWPDANLAVVTGVVSSLVVLDLDPRRGADMSRDRLEQEHGPLPETVEAESGSGGHHLYFHHPGGIIRDHIELAPGIDLRGDGGFVVAPPSVHSSGASYRWVRSPEVFHIEPLPAWLTATATKQRTRFKNWKERWQSHLREGFAGPNRADKISTLIEELLRNGMDPEATLELALCWNSVLCRPPLEEDSIVRIIEQETFKKSNQVKHVTH